MAEFKAFMHIAGTGHCSSTFPQQHRLVCSKLENIFSDSCDEVILSFEFLASQETRCIVPCFAVDSESIAWEML
jgi:hypothetical protein